MAKRAPLVLAFFVPGSSGCEARSTALQSVSHGYDATQVQFAAVAVRTDHADARKAVVSHHWTIPVAYDADGAVGDIYGVEVCPIVELARKGGVVANRLIGEHWASAGAARPAGASARQRVVVNDARARCGRRVRGPALHAEFPGLRLDWITVEARRRPSPRGVKHRLRSLSNRYHGASVVAMRTQPLPHAYRAFFRQIGLDPDATRIPSEEAAVARLMQGGFRSTDIVADALLIGLIETGVPVWALDADRSTPAGWGSGRRPRGSHSERSGYPLAAGRLVVADAERIHALLFGGIAPGHEVSSRTRRVTLFSVAVDGVPSIHVEEALWLTVDVLTS